MENSKAVLLISGTGGAFTIRGKDKENSLFDERMRGKLIDRHYTINGVRIIPENAYFIDENGSRVPLLRKNQSGYPPLVTRTLEDILEHGGISFESIQCDTIWEERPFKRQRYSIVCLSTTFMWLERMIDKAVRWVNENVEYDYLILGGHYSSIKYQFILEKYREVDYVIIGDGETALPMLIHHLLSGSYSLYEIPNLAWLDDGKVIKTEYKYEDIESLEKVSYDGNFERLSYESVRGCAFGCRFCTWDAGIKCFRFKSAEKITKDVSDYIRDNGIKRIEINDSTFMFPFKRIRPVLDGFIKLKIHWKAHSRSDVPWTDEMVRKLDESNCDILQIGFESMTQRILDNMHKGTTVEMNRFTNEMLKKSRVDTVVSFIIGYPDETAEEFENTWDFILNELYGHFYIFVFEMEDKSLELWQHRDEYGFELFEDKKDALHSGTNWKHNGMTSEQAFNIRAEVIRSVRRRNSLAIYKSWQSPYEWPFVTNKDKVENLRIERLIDNLIFLYQDVPEDDIRDKVAEIRQMLEEKGVFFE